MTFSVISPFVQATVTAVLLAFVIRLRKKTAPTFLFIVFMSFMTLWGLLIGIMRDSAQANAIYWEKAALISIAFTIVFFYYFAASHIKPRSRILHSIPGLFLAFSVAVAPTNLLVTGIGQDQFGNAPVWNTLFFPWVGFVYLIIVWSIIILNNARREAVTYEAKNRYVYLIAGALVCLIGGIFDVISLNIPPMSIVANIGFVLLTSIAILRYHLLDVRLVIRKSIAYFLVSAIVAVPYVGIIILLNLYLQQSLPIWANVALLLGLALILQGLWQKVQGLVDRMFYRERYNFLQELEQFSQKAHDISNLNELGSSFVGLIQRAFQTTNVHLLLSDESGNLKTIASIGTDTQQILIQNRSLLLQWFNENRSILQRQQLILDTRLQSLTAREKAVISDVNVALFVPLDSKTGGLVGLILIGPKRSEQPYSEEDLRRIITVASRVAVELENARLYAQEMAVRMELQHQNEQKTEFLHHVAHELKTPLTAVISSSELMTAEDIVNVPFEQRERLLNNINRSAWLMDRKVSELLDLARVQIGRVDLKLEPLDLPEIIEDLTSQLSSLFKNKEQSIETQLAPGLPKLRGDKEKITEIILNLLSNANKFSPAGGHILVKAAPEGNMVRLEVKDSAPIISDVDRSRIFDPYYRGGSQEDQQRVSGLGLGLAISKSLVILQKGEIGVTSEDGTGNTFYFTLPVWSEENRDS